MQRKESPSKGYFEDTEKSRGLDTVMSTFDLTESELEEGNVLDIGSGNALLAQDLSHEGNVYSVDPHFKPGVSKRRLFYSDEAIDSAKNKFAYARAEALPYPDETFGRIISLYAVPYYSQEESTVQKSVEEMLRVLEKNGSLYVYPVIDMSDDAPDDDFRNDLDIFPFRDKDRFNDILSRVSDEMQETFSIEIDEKKPLGRVDRARKGVTWYRVVITKE